MDLYSAVSSFEDCNGMLDVQTNNKTQVNDTVIY